MMDETAPEAANTFATNVSDDTYVKCHTRCTVTNALTCTAWEFNPILKSCKTFKTGTLQITGKAALED